jgi:hypothetical protein
MADLVTAIGSPIPQTLYPFLAVLLLIAGLVLTASFFIYEATSAKFSRKLSQEFATGGISSLFLVCVFPAVSLLAASETALKIPLV